MHPVKTVGPTGRPHQTAFAMQGDTAMIEMADAVGIGALPGGRLDPLGASTFGLGVVVVAAMDAGATRIVLGLGGSASTDGGAGLLQALGWSLVDGSGRELPPGGIHLRDVQAIESRCVDPRVAAVTIEVAYDVDVPLLGPRGSVELFAPQKGASRDDVELLHRSLGHWAECVRATTGRDVAAASGAGAGGGTGFAALAFLGAHGRSGAALSARPDRVRRRDRWRGPRDHR